MKKIGEVSISSNKICLGDPCYIKNSTNQLFQNMEVPNGKFPIFVDPEKGDYGRIIIIFNQEEFKNADPKYTERLDQVGVDSGTLMFSDQSIIDYWSEELQIQLEKSFDTSDFFSLNRNPETSAFIFKTGVGDGLFPIYWWYGEKEFEEFEYIAGLGIILKERFDPWL